MELAHVYSSHAVAITLFGLFGRALAYAQKSLDIRRSLRDLWGEGQSLSFFGCVLVCGLAVRRVPGKMPRGRAPVGDAWATTGRCTSPYTRWPHRLYRLGDFRGALEEAQRMHKSGVELGDEQASGISLDIWSLATGGKVPEEVLKQEVARERTDAQAKAQVLLAQGVQLMAAGQHEKATGAFQKGLDASQAIGPAQRLRRLPIGPGWPPACAARRRVKVGLTPQKRTELLASCRSCGSPAVRAFAGESRTTSPMRCANMQAFLLSQGKVRRACRLFEKSLAVAERQGAKYEYAQTLLAYGRLRRELGRPEADEQIAAAEAALRKIAFPSVTSISSGRGDDARPRFPWSTGSTRFWRSGARSPPPFRRR